MGWLVRIVDGMRVATTAVEVFMRRTTSRIVAAGILATVAVTAGALAGRAEQTTPAPDVLSALLVEVRGLRAAMERIASTDAEVQVVFGRLQLQEQRIVNQVRRLDSLKASLVDARRELDVLADRLKAQAESVILAADEPEIRRGREAELRERKRLWGRKNAEVLQLLSEEALLAQDIAAEQGRGSDFNQRLDALERALTRR
jgi:hypothetical protein